MRAIIEKKNESNGGQMIQLNPAITDLKGPTNFMRYCRIALLPKGLSLTIFFAIFFGNYLTLKNERIKAFCIAVK